MLVLAIIMVLVSLAVPRYMSSISVAEEAKAAQTMKNIHTAQEVYRITNGAYAPTFDQLKNTTPLAGAASSQTGSSSGSGTSGSGSTQGESKKKKGGGQTGPGGNQGQN